MLFDPFSGEAERTLRLFSSAKEFPESAYQLAKTWIDEEGRGRKGATTFSPASDRDYVLATHLLLRSVAAKCGHPSAEGRATKELAKRIARARVEEALRTKAYDARARAYKEDSVLEVFSDVLAPVPLRDLGVEMGIQDRRAYAASMDDRDAPKYGLRRARLLPLLRSTGKKLTDVYVLNGYAAASLGEMVDYYCTAVGIKAEALLSENWALEDQRMGELAEALGRHSARLHSAYAPFMKSKAGVGGRPLVLDHLPPCVKHTLEGVSSGSRNYAITVLLTSFLSYARIAPVGSNKDAKVSDYVSDVSVVNEEVLPMIEEAARRCTPPLFEDQPMERMNVIYHLGFGLTKEPKLEDAGRSNWYFPPNCDKIQREAPPLCNPDEHCRTIKNPLSYYAKKLFPPKEKEKEKERRELERTTKNAGERPRMQVHKRNVE